MHMVLDKSDRAAWNEYIQVSGMKTAPAFHVPQATIWVSSVIHGFGDYNMSVNYINQL